MSETTIIRGDLDRAEWRGKVLETLRHLNEDIQKLTREKASCERVEDILFQLRELRTRYEELLKIKSDAEDLRELRSRYEELLKVKSDAEDVKDLYDKANTNNVNIQTLKTKFILFGGIGGFLAGVLLYIAEQIFRHIGKG